MSCFKYFQHFLIAKEWDCTNRRIMVCAHIRWWVFIFLLVSLLDPSHKQWFDLEVSFKEKENQCWNIHSGWHLCVKAHCTTFTTFKTRCGNGLLWWTCLQNVSIFSSKVSLPYPLLKNMDHPVTNLGSRVNSRTANRTKKNEMDPSAKLQMKRQKKKQTKET